MAVSLSLPIEMRETSKNVIAVLGSVVLNFSGMYLAGLFLSGQGSAPVAAPEEEPNEMVIRLEELIPEVIQQKEETPPQPPQKAFEETYANQESAVAPVNARFESDRNTMAMTEKAAADRSAEAVPTQEGEEKIPFMQLQEHRYKEGPDKEIPRTPESEAGLPVAAAMMPQLPSEDVKEQDRPDKERDPNQSENREKEPDQVDPLAKQFADMEARQGEKEAKQVELKPGEKGGAVETMEMANVDLAKRISPLTDQLNVMDEKAPLKPEERDSMPERNPEPEDPARPMNQAPLREQILSAPLRAQPVSRKAQEAVAPLPPGAMASQPTHGVADEAAFSPEHHKNRMKGSLSNIGRTAAVDAEATPLGQYKKVVNRAIERRWHQLRMENESFLSFGSLRIRFEVQRDGRVRGLRVLHEDANAVMTSFSLQAINSAKIPPMPDEIVNLLGNDGLEATYDIIIY